MPVHDWTRVPSGLFHEFHQSWSVRIKDSLNSGLMPRGYYALVEQKVDGPEPDVIAVEKKGRDKGAGGPPAAVLEPPRTALTAHVASDAVRYARRANRISIRHPLGEVVAVVEIVSPGNKDSRNSIRSFVEKAVAFLRNGIHLLIVDLFPPSDRDPQGIHKAIWDELTDEPFSLPAGKSLTLVAYQAAGDITAYIEPISVGDALPDMPLFLAPGEHILVPLEATYDATWAACPEPIRELVEAPPAA
jgi:hypothetical protein